MTSEFIPLLEPSTSDAPTRRRPDGEDTAQRRSTMASASALEEDRKLVARLLQRETAAWSEFVRRYERLIAARISSACKETGTELRADLLDDCGAEVMAVLFHDDMAGLRRFEGRSKLSTWLCVVIRRTTFAVLKRRQREAVTGRQPDSRFDMALVPDDRPPEESGDSEQRARLRACLPQLSADDRRVLTLQFEEKLTYAQIAERMGITENAVGPKLHRAQQRLKKLMERRGKDHREE